MGSRREIGVNAMYGNEMIRLVGECDHVLRYGREDGTFNFAAVLGGEGSRDEVLGIISESGLGSFECWEGGLTG